MSRCLAFTGDQTRHPYLCHPSPAELVNLEHPVVLEGGEVDVALEDFDLEGFPLFGVQLANLLPQPRAVEQHGAHRPQLQVRPVEPPGREIYGETFS